MSDDKNKLRTHIEVKADKRAAALKANMQRRKSFVKSQKEQNIESDDDAKSSSDNK